MTTEQTELIEMLNCLEFETSQLNRAYQLWRSYVEKGTAPDWMAAAIRSTYDTLVTFYLETVSALDRDTSHAGEIDCYPSSGEIASPARLPALVERSRVLNPVRQGNRTAVALALAGVPRAFSAGCLALSEPAAGEILSILGEERTTAPSPELSPPSPESLLMTEPDWSGPEMPVANSPASTGDAISEQPAIRKAQQEAEAGTDPAGIHSQAILPLPN